MTDTRVSAKSKEIAEKVGKSNIDWERIEIEFRAGILTLRQIAAPYGISHVAVSKRAKKENWPKDLNAKIKEKAADLVNRQFVNKEVTKQQLVNEKQVIEANAQMQADIIISHRKDIQRNRSLSQKLLAEIEFTTDNIELFERLGEILIDTADDENNSAAVKRLEALHKVLSTSSRIDSAKKLSETLKTLISLEREAFGIDQKATAGEVLEDWLEKLDGGN